MLSNIVCIEMEELLFLMFGIKVCRSSRFGACHDSYGFILQLHSPVTFCTNLGIFMKFDMGVHKYVGDYPTSILYTPPPYF